MNRYFLLQSHLAVAEQIPLCAIIVLLYLYKRLIESHPVSLRYVGQKIKLLG